MINITNNEESKKIDEILINEYAMDINVLIENSAHFILKHIDIDKQKYIIACGPGNNGADGLALARLLHMNNKDVKIICKSNRNINYNICKNLKIEFIENVEPCDILIDALFGVGIKGELESYYQNLVDEINNKKNYKIISIDMITPNIKADKLIMLSSYKEDALNQDIDTLVCDIGIHKQTYQKASNKFLVDDEYISKIKKKRNIFANKGDFGKVAIYAQKGAALLAVSASIKSGSGYTFLLSDPDTIKANLIKNPECINLDFNERNNCEILAIGPNYKEENIKRVVEENIDKKLVLDAEALNMLSDNKQIIPKLAKTCILTPHPLEFSRISGYTLDFILKHPFEALKNFKEHYKGIILLKGKNTIIYDGENYYIINIGNSKMANAGMGDVLTGIIASLYAQSYLAIESCILGAYIHASLGNEISKYKNVVNPRDIIEKL